MTPTLAPRDGKCPVCTLVASPVDVTMRLYAEDGSHIETFGAVAYLRDVGLEGTVRQLTAKVIRHRRHIDRWMEKSGGAVAPAQIADGVTRIPPPMAPSSWVDVNQQGMNLGQRAQELIAGRMEGMETGDLIKVARLGQAAATTRATLEVKGALKRAEQLAKLASGFQRKEPA